MDSSPSIFDTTDPDSRLLQALRALGNAFATNPFDLRWRGVPISVRQTSGSSTSIELRTPYPGALVGTPRRPLQIVLRPEEETDRAAKRAGKAIEAQTGDLEFDSAIYIETPAEPELAAQVLSASELRAAVLTLLRTGFQDLIVDNAEHQIYIRLYATAHIEAWSVDASRLLDLFATIALSAPRHDSLPERRADGPVRLLTALLLATGAASMAFAALAMRIAPAVCQGEGEESVFSRVGIDPACWRPYPLGLALALVFAAMGHRRFAPAFRGRADSHRRAISLPLLLLVACAPLGIAIAMWGLWSR